MQLNMIRGCMIGGAVGDARGWSVEFKSEREIFNVFWPDGTKEYVLNPAGEAEITDDTQMALFTANGCYMERLRICFGGLTDLSGNTLQLPTRTGCIRKRKGMRKSYNLLLASSIGNTFRGGKLSR